MIMIPEQYFFEGETTVVCQKCGLKHTISFSGVNPSGIEEAIEEAMVSDGWGVVSMTCPDCYDPLDERKAVDAMMLEDIDLDDDEDDEWSWDEVEHYR